MANRRIEAMTIADVKEIAKAVGVEKIPIYAYDVSTSRSTVEFRLEVRIALSCFTEFKDNYRHFKTQSHIFLNLETAVITVPLKQFNKYIKNSSDDETWEEWRYYGILHEYDFLNDLENAFDVDFNKIEIRNTSMYSTSNQQNAISSLIEDIVKRGRKEGFLSDYGGYISDDHEKITHPAPRKDEIPRIIDELKNNISFVRYANGLFSDKSILDLKTEYKDQQEKLRIAKKAQKDLLEKIKAKTVEKMSIMMDD